MSILFQAFMILDATVVMICNIERNLECQSDAFPPQIDTDKAKKVDLSNETEVQ